MATNYVQDGKTITLTAPYQRNSGLGAQVGSIFGVALQTVANAVAGEFATTGVWLLAKTSAQAWTQGQKIYWDDSNKRCDNDSTVGMLIGVATAAAANPSSTGYVRLNGSSPATAEGPQTVIAALTDNSGGATADGTIAAVAAAAGACSGGSSPSATNVDTAIATAVAPIVTKTNDAVKELATEVNAILAALKAAGIIASS